MAEWLQGCSGSGESLDVARSTVSGRGRDQIWAALEKVEMVVRAMQAWL